MTDHEQLIGIASGETTTSYEQRKAIAELGQLDDQTSLAALVGLLSTEDRYLRRDVVKAIGTHGSASAPIALIHCLSDSIENVRRDAATLLGARNDGRAVDPLKLLLDDKGYAVRHAAKSSLELLEREGIEAVALDPHELAGITSQQAPLQATSSVQETHTRHTYRDPAKRLPETSVDSPTPFPTTEPPPQPEAPEPKPDRQVQPSHSQSPAQTTEQPADHVATLHDSQPDATTEQQPPQPDSTQPTHTPTKPNLPVAATPQSHSDASESSPSNLGSHADSTFEEEVILAELVPDSTADNKSVAPSQLKFFEERHTDFAVEQLVSPTPPPGFNWDTAQRFNRLFEKNVGVLKSHYASLHKKQTEAIDSEKRFENALLKHDLVQADLADALMETTQDANQQLETLKQVESEGDSLATSLKRIKRASTGITFSIANLFWPTRTELFHHHAKDLKAKLRRANETSEASRVALSTTQSKSDSLNAPLREVEEELVAASQAAIHSQQELRDIRNAIDNEILAAIQNHKSQGTEAFITHSPRSETLRQCIAELGQHQTEHHSLQAALFELESPLNEDKQRFNNAAAKIATSVADGFIKTPRTQEVNSNVSCSVAFRAASVSTSRSHRLEGKAQGSAQLKAHYDYEEISWNGEEQVRENLNEFNESATKLGSLQALHAIRSTELASSAYCVRNCVAFIRLELEKDFEAQQ